jgi:hypothetical protein
MKHYDKGQIAALIERLNKPESGRRSFLFVGDTVKEFIDQPDGTTSLKELTPEEQQEARRFIFPFPREQESA